MRIAIAGTGFCGLATAVHLLQKNPSVELDLFDEKEIGQGCSGIAAGLLHPFVGVRARLNWQGYEGWEATCQLLKIASDAIHEPVVHFSGIFRPAITQQQQLDFKLCASQYREDTVWLEEETCQKTMNGLLCQKGLLIKKGAVVNCPLYLSGLWAYCESNGSHFYRQEIKNLRELASYDKVVIATGAHIRSLQEFKHLSVTPVKGQILHMRSSSSLPFSSIPVNSQAYLIQNSASATCLVGSTYEKEFLNEFPDLEIAKAELLPKIQSFFPELALGEILDCKAGIRASTPTHLPLIGNIDDRTFFITGMGSKGLLYHALFAKQLVDTLL